MNEKQFIREIKSKSNRDGRATGSIIVEFLQTSRGLELTSKANIFTRFFSRFRKVKSVRQIVEDNLELILSMTNDDQIDNLLFVFNMNDEISGIIEQNLDIVMARLARTPKNMEDNAGGTYTLDIVKTDFLRDVRNLPNGEEILTKNIDNILNSGFKLRDVKALRGLTKEIDDKLNDKLEGNLKQVARDLIEESSIADKDVILKDYTTTLGIMIKELLQSENARVLDMTKIGRGTYSTVYQIKNKILKLGQPRETYNIPNHTRILQPLTRINFVNEKDGYKPLACVEISDVVDKIPKEEKSKEELYKLYKELRKDRIIWTDAEFRNIGKLRRKNIPTLNGEEMNVAPNSIGFSEEKQGKDLAHGDWVIIDTDFIYYEDDKKIEGSENSYWREFERRWQRERQGEATEIYGKETRNVGDTKPYKEYKGKDDRGEER